MSALTDAAIRRVGKAVTYGLETTYGLLTRADEIDDRGFRSVELLLYLPAGQEPAVGDDITHDAVSYIVDAVVGGGTLTRVRLRTSVASDAVNVPIDLGGF